MRTSAALDSCKGFILPPALMDNIKQASWFVAKGPQSVLLHRLGLVSPDEMILSLHLRYSEELSSGKTTSTTGTFTTERNTRGTDPV
ncbi:hypothetical protein Y1Q_0007427 [Alligator mississippiensis]|uniref:Uncharacterized protein n=1 Tax=Alligator mississippiensis TaxID=8496 RepID=A0A151P7W1_ALLMI|nr:hypothetical protein Y1Q_0007427 [Alligator mississippiensis]